jgi:hypothetical protein
MAAESWFYAEPPERESQPWDRFLFHELKVSVVRSVPATEPMPEGCLRTRAEVEFLRDQAVEELKLGDWMDDQAALIDGRRRLRVMTGHLDCNALGILNTCRWVLGETPVAPMSGQSFGYPIPVRDRESEAFVTSTLAYKSEIFLPGHDREWKSRGFSYAEGVHAALAWFFTEDAALGKRPMMLPGEKK